MIPLEPMWAELKRIIKPNRAKNNGTLANFVDKCKKITSRIEMDEGYFNIAVERINMINP